jgi:broad specificity phosphatase PhoE
LPVQATRLTLICHARTVAWKLARFALDEPLEMDWQAHRLSRCKQFKGTPRLVCGPELRTRQTAELFGSAPQIVDALKDCDFGRWAGVRINELQKTQAEELQHWMADPASAPHGGESVLQLEERLGAWLTTLQPGHIVAITHPFVIRAALAHVLQGAASNLIDVERLPGTDFEEPL